ncbi:hypothetical protein CASFOL_012977 [Castilleja foliolosa]|uniref:F-box domain-containing protein n=1 Tax=Castilleja foliolosa TaxID=1961234 RepID=A0ABD3DJD2_9LAMI
MDRISQLPQPILHHILSFLSQKESVQTCSLSKTWRYLGSTRPKFDYNGSDFGGNTETFRSVLGNTLQRYHDQKLSIQDFRLETCDDDSLLFPLLELWMPILITHHMGLKKLTLCFLSPSLTYFDLPLIIFQVKSLQSLNLEGCNLGQIGSVDNIQCRNLQTLYLKWVYITEEILDKIMSNCPLIEYLSLQSCEGFHTITFVNKNHILEDFPSSNFEGKGHCIEIGNVRTLEIIQMWGSPNRYNHRNMLFPNLKSLLLDHVLLSSELVGRFSSIFPCLEELSLIHCFGFRKFELSSRSIKRLLILEDMQKWVLGAIDVMTIHAPNLVEFEYACDVIPNISFTKTQKEWKSDISICSAYDGPLWFHKLIELLEAVSGSEISLHVWKRCMGNIDDENEHIDDQYSLDRVVVEHLKFSIDRSEYASSFLNFMDNLFRVCCPREIHSSYAANADAKWDRAKELSKVTEFLCKILQMDRLEDQEMRWWQQDLEEVSFEVFDDVEYRSNETTAYRT